jgi:predicted metal-dependent phosphotriesterase family hydrolase
MVEAIRAVGAEHCIITTDLGQYMNPPAAEGMRMFIALLLKNGITEHEIELMAKVNPSKLLGLN